MQRVDLKEERLGLAQVWELLSPKALTIDCSAFQSRLVG